jgi:hypothetical protein
MIEKQSILDYEDCMLRSVATRIAAATSMHDVQVIYNQARIWNRCHHVFADACTRERYRKMNELFKTMRNMKKKELMSEKKEDV